VNPKAETVGELKERRRKMHMGMCELLREDLSHQDSEKLNERLAKLLADGRYLHDTEELVKELLQKDVHKGPREVDSVCLVPPPFELVLGSYTYPFWMDTQVCVKKDFDALIDMHGKKTDDEFNQDETYKVLINNAIDGKHHALKKMIVHLEWTENSPDRDSPHAKNIMQQPLHVFADPAAVMALRTGIESRDFPWTDVMAKTKTEINLNEWDAAPISKRARGLVAGVLGCNTVIKAVIIKGVRLELSEGWATLSLDWTKKPAKEAVAAVPATASIVLRCCAGLKFLFLRCSCTRGVDLLG
jgi:hypothetical protein